MNHANLEEHGPSLALARSEVGHVSMCPCGVVTVTLHYISLRFEPAAFRELLGMLNFAQQRITTDPALEFPQPAASVDAPPVH
ncbi:MAG TPA: hypothetical protein VHQ87_00900 [Rhizobacter sp.]|jgi:hypothetical protein|nr:hypothetical protein [Rhizobacter sp.]